MRSGFKMSIETANNEISFASRSPLAIGKKQKICRPLPLLYLFPVKKEVLIIEGVGKTGNQNRKSS
jgi:hypothetical protein